MNIEKAIRDYLPQIIHMSLASCAGDKPWISEVHFVYDNNLNFFFRSTKQRRHSTEFDNNPNVSGSIVKQHLLEQEVRGVSFEGFVTRLEYVDENSNAYKLYCERFDIGPEILEELNDENGHHFYKVTVNKFYIFDSYESSPGKKYELEWCT